MLQLEFVMPEAIRQRADIIITAGGHQSSHARIVAATARRFGMHSLLIFRGERPESWQGNLLLDRLLGAEHEFLPYDEYLDQVGPTHRCPRRAAAHQRAPSVRHPAGRSDCRRRARICGGCGRAGRAMVAPGAPAPDYIVTWVARDASMIAALRVAAGFLTTATGVGQRAS